MTHRPQSHAHTAAQIEKWLREASNETGKALKCAEPDNVDYWDYYRLYDEAKAGTNEQRDIEQEIDVDIDPDEPGIAVIERLIRIGYPQKTQYAAKMDLGYRKLDEVKRWLKTNSPNQKDYEIWCKCHPFWEKRHEIIVQEKLQGDAKAEYVNMDANTRAVYKTLEGFQKTNFLIRFLTDRLFVNIEEDANLAEQKFSNSKMQAWQNARDYINFLEDKRIRLRQIGRPITDEKFRTVLMTSLNEGYRKACQLYEYEERPLAQVKKRLMSFDPVEILKDFKKTDRFEVKTKHYLNRKPHTYAGNSGRHDKPSDISQVSPEQFRLVANKLKERRDKLKRRLNESKFPTARKKIAIKCFKCFQLGHYANECPNKDTNSNSKTAMGAVANFTEDDEKSEDYQDNDEDWEQLINYNSDNEQDE